MTIPQRTQFVGLFGTEAARRLDDTAWRESWAAQLTDLTLGSDGFLPFRDNLDYAAAGGVSTVVEPGGSLRTPEVRVAASDSASGTSPPRNGSSTTDYVPARGPIRHQGTVDPPR